MPANTRTLTDEETKAVNKEYTELTVKLETQTVEQCEFLKAQIENDENILGDRGRKLINIINHGGFKLRAFRLSDANAMQQMQTQVTYDIDDDLYAYLTQPQSMLPKRLRGFLDGGMDITNYTNKEAATDTSPLTGKTKTGVREYDEMIKRRS